MVDIRREMLAEDCCSTELWHVAAEVETASMENKDQSMQGYCLLMADMAMTCMSVEVLLV